MKSLLGVGSFLILMVIVARMSDSIAAAGEKRPNILFIYADDQSNRTVGCYPQAFDWVRTPNLDQLAAAGVRFEHAYIGTWCMPSRSTMLTGFHQHKIESMRMVGKYPGSEYDPEQCRFWPAVFRENGYTTAQIGKWHTGTDTGFGRDWDFQIVWNRPAFPENAGNYYDRQMISKNGAPAEMVEGYTTDLYTNWAVDFINGEGRDPQKPWYLWLCYGAVHGPYTPAARHQHEYESIEVPIPTDVFGPRPGKPEYLQKSNTWVPNVDGEPIERKGKNLSGRPLKDWIRQYHEGVLAIDENVGRLLEALRTSGQDENTLIVYTADQGFAWGQKGLKSKVAPYDGAIAAPLIIRPPAGKNQAVAGRVVHAPVSGVDLPPTFFSQAGFKLPWTMHGHDLSPLLESRSATWSAPAMVVHTARIYGSDTDEVPKPDDPALYNGPGVPWYVLLAEGNYKYIRTLVDGEIEELYHLGDDPNELHNLAMLPEYQSLLTRYRNAAINELKRTSAGFVKNLPHVGTPGMLSIPVESK